MSEMGTALPDVSKLRRFALAIGLVLLTYSLAAVELKTGETIRPLGVPLKVNGPEWLGIGLSLASLYALLRFWYYGVATVASPAARRRSRLSELEIRRDYQLKAAWKGNMPGELQIQVDSLMQVFPRIPGMRIKLYPDPFREQGAAPRTVERIEIPRLMRIAARLQDLDYTAPIWVNGLALAFALHRALSPWLEKISC